MSNNIVDVLLVVDADYVKANPTTVGNGIFLLAQRSVAHSEREGPQYQDGGNELWIKVASQDVIRWRATTLSRNANISAVITKVYAGSESEGGTFSNIDFVSPMQMNIPYVTGLNPLGYNHTSVPVSFWQATAGDVGWLAYQINFHLLDASGKPFPNDPTYSWDPYITITD